MESGCSKNVEACPQLLDLIPQQRRWHMKREDERRHGSSEEKKLELRLGPPGEDNWSIKIDATKSNNKERDESLLSLGYFPSMNSNAKQTHTFPTPEDHPVGSVLSSPWANTQQHNHQQQTKPPSFLQFSSTAPQTLPVIAKESSQPCCTKAVDLHNAEKTAFSLPPANTSVPPNSSQKRTAPGPVVGWPPIRSFRKNLASSSSSKLASESPSVVPHKVANEKAATEPTGKGLFVKINMDGVPIGRKVDLRAYDSYEKLSTAVDELFRGLLAAQRDSCAGGIVSKQEEEKVITGVLDGSGEYTLVYEDNEGDRMLVGDVPWHMFVSTVKRLRVLKSSELSALSLGSSKQGKMPA
ncbi:PREDICTED: auxin-responsive protein IAA26 isoform X1 [Theobroma cacao]|uniref:Auxin-responsive protein n=2 Tax=Theobroma cacao TaxID=3641 RepID=A0AB32UZV3_THECC|nr:PREDICTED: auxin-responsive protein IAA26 isoform X1 [Theobroma cacao]EOY26941.1 Phytochrome-associated protein 1, putative [Theobroma cacao]